MPFGVRAAGKRALLTRTNFSVERTDRLPKIRQTKILISASHERRQNYPALAFPLLTPRFNLCASEISQNFFSDDVEANAGS